MFTSGKSSQEELVVSGDTDYLEYDSITESDLKSPRYLIYSNQILQRGSLQQVVENENQSLFLKSTVSQQRKMRIPLVSAPDDILTENGDNSSVPRSKSHDDEEQPGLFNKDMIKDKLDNDKCLRNTKNMPNINESDSDMSSPTLTYWENKLLQRQKCGNIFIKNDQESSQSSSENWDAKDKCHYVNDKENILYKNQYADSSGPFNSNIIRFSNSVKQNQVQHTDKVRNYDDQEHECIKINVGRNSFHTTSTVNPKTEKCENNILKENENQGSKWGKYADFDDEADEADDFLTFDQSFSVPGVTDQAEKPTISLRPWTKHNETFNGDESSDVPELTDHKENPVISLRPWTKCNDRFSMLDMPHQAEKHTISLQPAKSQDNFDFSDSNPSDAMKGSQSFNKNEVIASSQKFQSTSHNIKEQFLSRHISEKQYLSPVIASSKSNRYQIANNQNFNQNTQSTITRTNEPNFSYGNPSNVESMEEDSVTCVPSSDNYNPGKRFKCPVPQLTSCILKGTKRNLGSDLQFPSIQEITENSQLVREIEIPTRFTSLGNYKQVFTAALKEHLNIILFDLGVKYHHALSKIDTTSYLPTVQGKENKGTVNSNPVCKCGAPSKMIQVKKSGPNHNRFFYACYAARNSQCKVNTEN
ncbi:unnamed protein product [Mytilus coruscus]|uniref:GRF-type domain-containing protein n=1 Tax=Mytilus coruscus TaxID=42192 RepID=A0A6J8AG43_MYTCO|nr:unnamed protein product [Mytilus coruscus]